MWHQLRPPEIPYIYRLGVDFKLKHLCKNSIKSKLFECTFHNTKKSLIWKSGVIVSLNPTYCLFKIGLRIKAGHTICANGRRKRSFWTTDPLTGAEEDWSLVRPARSHRYFKKSHATVPLTPLKLRPVKEYFAVYVWHTYSLQTAEIFYYPFVIKMCNITNSIIFIIRWKTCMSVGI